MICELPTATTLAFNAYPTSHGLFQALTARCWGGASSNENTFRAAAADDQRPTCRAMYDDIALDWEIGYQYSPRPRDKLLI
jgi:hypothetical protein